MSAVVQTLNMGKFRRAVFCYYILGFDRGLHPWILSLSLSKRRAGLLGVFSDRQMVARWLTDMFAKKMDFDLVLHLMSGDAFYEKNKNDVVQLERASGKKITTLWDTDPIFAKYPHLRGFARNREFEEKIWPAIRAAAQKTR